MALEIYLVAINLLTAFLYWHDKRAARRQNPRVPEYVLLLAGFLGGTIAAFITQRVMHHKTRKTSFQLQFWGLTAIQLWLLFSPPEVLRPVVAHLHAL